MSNTKTLARLGGLALLLLTLLGAAPAFAQGYTVCGFAKYFDTRSERAPGSVVAGNGNYNTAARRVKLYLYDQDNCKDADPGCNDSGANLDDLLGSVYSHHEDGSFCFNSVPVGNDVYILTKYESDDTRLRFDGDINLIATSPTDWDIAANLTKNFNLTCYNSTGNATCANRAEADLYPTHQNFANALATAVDVDVLVTDSLYHTNGFTDPITIYDRSTPAVTCTQGGDYSVDCDDICVRPTSMVLNYRVAHEIGHNLHKRNINFCGKISQCAGAFWTNTGNERCVTAEGFADFVALATHWSPSSTSAAFQGNASQNAEGTTTTLNSGSSLNCASQGNWPWTSEANVARYFWDLYDSTSVGDGWLPGATDNTSLPFSTILSDWDDFPQYGLLSCPIGAGPCCTTVGCTADRENQESGTNGRNVWDYDAYTTGNSALVTINCLNNQELN